MMGTEVRWSASYALWGTPEIGAGSSPDIFVKYLLNGDDPDDKTPPDNSWFGTKEISVSIGGSLVIKRPVTFCFLDSALAACTAAKMMGYNKVSAWYYYYECGNAVSGLADFTYVENLDDGVQAKWNDVSGFKIARKAILGAEQAVIIDEKYTQKHYDKHTGIGCHGIAKLCEHERWHERLYSELIWEWLFFWKCTNDADGDGLSDDRERELKSNPDKRDTFGISKMDGYGNYASYGDEEVFCRLKQDGVLGVENKDWNQVGPQILKLLGVGENGE